MLKESALFILTVPQIFLPHQHTDPVLSACLAASHPSTDIVKCGTVPPRAPVIPLSTAS